MGSRAKRGSIRLSGADHPSVLQWAADQGRIVVTHEISTMAKHAFDRIAAGQPMPGVFEVTSVGPYRTGYRRFDSPGRMQLRWRMGGPSPLPTLIGCRAQSNGRRAFVLFGPFASATMPKNFSALWPATETLPTLLQGLLGCTRRSPPGATAERPPGQSRQPRRTWQSPNHRFLPGYFA